MLYPLSYEGSVCLARRRYPSRIRNNERVKQALVCEVCVPVGAHVPGVVGGAA